MKHIKLFENYFGMDLVKLLEPAYKLIEKQDISKLDKIKSKLIESLDEYKDYILELTTNKYRKDVDIDSEIKKIESSLNETITKNLNLVNFLRTISNIVIIPKRKSDVKIDNKFEEYYETLDERIKRAIDVIDIKGEEYLDEEDGEVSVLNRREYVDELKELQAELNKLMEDVVKNGRKVAILFEGFDSSGKGSTIKRFTHYMNPKYYKIITMGIPSKEELEGPNWFARYKKEMPKEGQIAFFDRSYFGMGITNISLGYCSDEQYEYFMNNVNQFEKDLNNDGIELIKFWFSISKEKQIERFDLRKKSPLKYWKFSPSDEKAMSKWDILSKYRDQCFSKASTVANPFVIVQSNDKKLSSLNSIRYVLNKLDYDGKDIDVIGNVYPDVVYELK